MQLSRKSLLRWANTLKFKIVAMAVVTGVVSALGTTQIALSKTQAEIERLLLRNDADDSERTAALLANKLDMLQLALGAVARQATPEYWLDSERMTRYLVDKPAAVALFDSIFAAAVDGQMLARVEKENASAGRVNIADREYFQRALKTDQPVISRAVVGKVHNVPIIVIAIPVLSVEGRVTGVIGG